MRQESKFGLTFLHADKSKKLRKKGGTVLYGAVALSKNDSIDNYEEVDELWSSDDTTEIEVITDEQNEGINITPDEYGNISYEDAKKIMNEISLVKKRIMNLQKSHDMLLKIVEELKNHCTIN